MQPPSSRSFHHRRKLRVVAIYDFEYRHHLALPLVEPCVPAGFPSPADEFEDHKLDLNEFLIRHPEATFFVRVAGDSMIGAGIFSGDLLIVDRAVEPFDGAIIIACVHNEFTVKRIKLTHQKLFLIPENEGFLPIEVTEDMDFRVWGVVTGVVRNFSPTGRKK